MNATNTGGEAAPLNQHENTERYGGGSERDALPLSRTRPLIHQRILANTHTFYVAKDSLKTPMYEHHNRGFASGSSMARESQAGEQEMPNSDC